MTNSPLSIQVCDLRFSWKSEHLLLDIPTLEIPRGSRTFLMGSSGSGKSTLLGVLAGILQPQSGKVLVQGVDLTTFNPTRKDAFRSDHLGVIFQMFNLLPYLSVAENSCLPCKFSKTRAAKAIEQFGSAEEAGKQLLNALGIDPILYWNKPVGELSVGQQQRVAATRALIGSPDIIIADEPTSALDTDSRNNFIDLLSNQVERNNATLLFVSHDRGLAKHFDQVIDLNTINKASSINTVVS